MKFWVQGLYVFYSIQTGVKVVLNPMGVRTPAVILFDVSKMIHYMLMKTWSFIELVKLAATMKCSNAVILTR